MSGARRFCVIVSCKDRLEFLRSTAPRILACPEVRYCLVDYACPERCGDWLSQSFPEASSDGRLLIERVPAGQYFNKSAALNTGARRALREGAEYLCFLDADTLIGDGFFTFLASQAAPARFLIAGLRPDGTDPRSLTGVLVLPAAAYSASAGFDEEFLGWGGEDIEFRLRLHVLHGLSYARIPLALLEPIEHDDSLRCRYYQERDPARSDRRNHVRLIYKLHGWLRERGRELGAARELMFQGGPRRTLPGAGL
jgi:hypothetical protein